jgi:hypothetical protein
VDFLDAAPILASKTVQRVTGCNISREDLIALSAASTNCSDARWIQVDHPFDSGSGHSVQLTAVFYLLPWKVFNDLKD